MDYIVLKFDVMATEDDGKKGGAWSESGFDASIPVWDGRADSLREYKRTVRWWLSAFQCGSGTDPVLQSCCEVCHEAAWECSVVCLGV